MSTCMTCRGDVAPAARCLDCAEETGAVRHADCCRADTDRPGCAP